MDDNLKTLRVCLSSELPELSNRDPNYIYFLYDKLLLYIGQSLYNDHYAIVEKEPEYPITGMLYFILDGKVKIYIDYIWETIAQIENDEQLEILKQSGSIFFVNAERRYLDLQKRTITLPYSNGTYELTVSLAKDLKIDENTIIKFNTETNEFEIVGNIQDHDMVFTRDYIGKETASITTEVSEHRVSSEIKLSRAFDNILKIIPGEGLYADASGKVTKEEFRSWVSKYQDYKANMEYYLKDLNDQINGSLGSVSEKAVSSKIQTALQEVYPEINSILLNLDSMYKKFEEIEERSKTYTDEAFQKAYDEIYGAVLNAMQDPWETIEDS